jgi:NADPH2:quinone reductase
MKAIIVNEFGAPDVMKYQEVAMPLPGIGQVLVKIMAAGVNPFEAYIRSGAYPLKPKFPYTPGADSAGTIEEVGKDVTAFKKGDRVYTSGSVTGTYAEAALCEQRQVHPLPEQTSFLQGAALGVP